MLDSLVAPIAGGLPGCAVYSVPQRPRIGNALKRAIYTGRVSPAQAKRLYEMQAVLDRWTNRRQSIPSELTGRIAPTRLEGINLRGVFRFPIERYADQLLPSQRAAKTSAAR